MIEHQSTNELEWSAFCYLAGEMSPGEVEEFESRLADDHSVREALARAVELTQVVAAAEAQGASVAPAARSSADWTTRLSWMAIGGLAALLIGMLWAGVIGRSPQIEKKRGVDDSQMALADAWSQARAEDGELREPLWPFASTVGQLDDELLAAGNYVGDDPMLPDAPSWMTTAVFSLSGRSLEHANHERLEN